MKSFAISALALAAAVDAHSIMQKIKVAGVDQGAFVGIRAPPNNNPVQSVASSDLICGASGYTSSKVITIPAGSAVSGAWAHNPGGPQGVADADNPIASSHHGPTQVYLAKVSDASTASQTGLSWFKIAANTVTSSGVWGVDVMNKNVDSAGYGWQDFTMPSCIAPGNYLMRVEIVALHSASSSGGAQFYQSCAQIQVTGSGSFSPASSDLASFPGTYSASDPGILVNIYSSSIYTSYQAPGPKPISCGGGSGSSPASTTTKAATPTTTASTTTAKPVTTTLVTSTKTTTAAATTTSKASTGGTVAQYGQCGGSGYTGPTTCASPYTCKANGAYYSQCV
nr:hypothetical protein B0A51_03793 [Rachicladosporium sp. CCFEE 5018]